MSREENGAGHRYSWIGDDCPSDWRRVGTIDVADPADIASALDRGFRIGGVYDGMSFSVAEPCAADVYREIEDEALAPHPQQTGARR